MTSTTTHSTALSAAHAEGRHGTDFAITRQWANEGCPDCAKAIDPVYVLSMEEHTIAMALGQAMASPDATVARKAMLTVESTPARLWAYAKANRPSQFAFLQAAFIRVAEQSQLDAMHLARHGEARPR